MGAGRQCARGDELGRLREIACLHGSVSSSTWKGAWVPSRAEQGAGAPVSTCQGPASGMSRGGRRVSKQRLCLHDRTLSPAPGEQALHGFPLLFTGLAAESPEAGVPGTFCSETVLRTVGGTRAWNPASLRGASLPRTWVTPSEDRRAKGHVWAHEGVSCPASGWRCEQLCRVEPSLAASSPHGTDPVAPAFAPSPLPTAVPEEPQPGDPCSPRTRPDLQTLLSCADGAPGFQEAESPPFL